MSNVVRLASSNDHPRARACTDCKHFHPDVAAFGYDGWSFLGIGPGKTPTASAMRFATCSAAGGAYARSERVHNCKGQLWEPQP